MKTCGNCRRSFPEVGTSLPNDTLHHPPVLQGRRDVHAIELRENLPEVFLMGPLSMRPNIFLANRVQIAKMKALSPQEGTLTLGRAAAQ